MHDVLWEAKLLLHCRRVYKNPKHCVTVQSLHQLCRRCFETSSRRPRHPQAQWGLSLYGHGHVQLMIEILIMIDLHRGGSSPLACLPLGQGTDIEQTPSSYTVWMIRVGVPTRLARIRWIKTWSMGTFAVSVLAGCWCSVLSHNWDNDDLAHVLNM